MRKIFLIIFILLSVSCSKKVMVSSSPLQTKMKMESEKARIERRDKKIGLLIIWAVYGFGLSYIANTK